MKTILAGVWLAEVLLCLIAFLSADIQLSMGMRLYAASIGGTLVMLAWLAGYRLGRKFPLGPSGMPTATHLIVGVTVVAVILPFLHALAQYLSPAAEITSSRTALDLILAWPPGSIVLVASSIGGGHALAWHQGIMERSATELRLEQQLMVARAFALKAQLHPHFLFNALNAVSGLAATEPDVARSVTRRLRILMQDVLTMRERQEVSVAEELAVLESYIGIERVRFGQRVRVVTHMDETISDAAIPHLLLQPLVENAFRHGVGGLRGGRFIAILAMSWDGRIRFVVRDDGPGLKIPFAEGIGLSNTRARLQVLYSGQHTISVRTMPSGGSEVCVEIPRRPVST